MAVRKKRSKQEIEQQILASTVRPAAMPDLAPPSLDALIIKHGGWDKVPEEEWGRHADALEAWLQATREGWFHDKAKTKVRR